MSAFPFVSSARPDRAAGLPPSVAHLLGRDGAQAGGCLAGAGSSRDDGGVLGAATSRPLFGILLALHVAAALGGFGALVATGVQGYRLPRVREPQAVEQLQRFFRPGTNWAARVLYLVPVLGAALVTASGGTYHFDDRFVEVGLGLWAVAAVIAEAVLWPAERRVQRSLRAGWPQQPGAELRRDCRTLSWSAGALAAVFLVAVVVMAGRW